MKRPASSPLIDRHHRQRDDGYRRRLQEMNHFFEDAPASNPLRSCRVGIVLQQAAHDEVAFHLRRLFEQGGQSCRVRPWQFACTSQEALPMQYGSDFQGIDLIPMITPNRDELDICESVVFIIRPDLLSMKRLYHNLRSWHERLRHKPVSLIMAEACDRNRAALYLDFLGNSIDNNLQLPMRWVGTLCCRDKTYGNGNFEFRPLRDEPGWSGRFPEQILSAWQPDQ